jgi:DNA-binding transcriptional MerR regulator
MFQIKELSAKTGVPTKTIRYYESVDLLPSPKRASNGYRLYDEADAERLNFIRRARALDFALEDIVEILAFRERGEPPCRYVMNTMRQRIVEVEARIRDLQRLKDELHALYEAGKRLPEDAQMRTCVCHLIHSGIERIDVTDWEKTY